MLFAPKELFGPLNPDPPRSCQFPADDTDIPCNYPDLNSCEFCEHFYRNSANPQTPPSEQS